MKYEMTDVRLERFGKTLYRIQATRDFNDVKKGDFGGWIESEDNLSHDGNAWVCDNAKVCDNAVVYGNVKLCGNVVVYGDAEVCNYQLTNNKTGGNKMKTDMIGKYVIIRGDKSGAFAGILQERKKREGK